MTWLAEASPSDERPENRNVHDARAVRSGHVGNLVKALSLPAMLTSTAPTTGSGPTYPDHWWDESHWTALQLAGPYAADLAKITVADPPSSKADIRKELDDILAKQQSDEAAVRRPEIIEEAEGPPSYYEFMLFTDEIRRPLTARLIGASIGTVSYGLSVPSR